MPKDSGLSWWRAMANDHPRLDIIVTDSYDPSDGPRCTLQELNKRIAKVIWQTVIEEGLAIKKGGNRHDGGATDL